MKISIIVPVYKAEAYLRECLDSILGQSLQDFELLLVDDGSPDGSGAICDEYAARDPRVRVLHKANGGASSARNAGISAAQGEYLSFVDSDDVLHPRMLEHLFRAALENDAEASVSSYRSFTDQTPIQPEPYALRRVAPGRDFCLEPYRIEYVAPWAKLYRRDLFSDIRFPEYLRMCEDEAILYRLFYKCSRVAELDAPLYYYRTTPGSTMNAGFSMKNYDIIPALKDKLAFFIHQEDVELAKISEEELALLRAKLSLKARKEGLYDQVHLEDRVGKRTALKRIKAADDRTLYDWYYSISCPHRARLAGLLRAVSRRCKGRAK